MFNLQLDPNQQFSVSPNNDFQFQDWSFSPPQVYEVISYIGGAIPSNLIIQTQIKNYIASLGTDTYVKFYVTTELHFISQYNSTAWFTASGVLPDATGNGYLLSETNLNVATTLSFQNLDQMPQGYHEAYIKHSVWGELANGTIQFIEREDYYIALQRTLNTTVQCQPTYLDFAHLIGNPLPAGQTVNLFATGAFTVEIPYYFSLTGSNIFLESITGGIKTYSGSDSQDVTLTLNNLVENFGETINMIPPHLTGYFWIKNAAGESDQSLIKVFQYVTATYTAAPLYLEFFAIQGILEPSEQIINVIGYGSFSASAPSWLTLDNFSGSNNGQIIVVPVNASNLSPGEYNDVITITTSTGDITIIVKHTVVGALDINFDPSGINLTRDRNKISNFYNDDAVTLHISIDTLSFNYNLLATKLTNSQHKKGIFNNTANFFFGNVIEKKMFKLNNLDSINLDYFPSLFNPLVSETIYGGTLYKYYNPSLSKITTYFKSRQTGLQVGPTEVFNNVKYLKGRKPARLINSYGILDFKESPIRVTVNSITILNLFRSVGFNKVEILKNGTVIKTFTPDNGNNQVFGMRLDFLTFVPGDIIDAVFYNSINNNLKKYSQKYIMFPEGKHSYHIGWENEHGVLELLEFTGDYSFASKYDEVIATTFINYLEQLNKYESEKELTFNANTGWILKSNQERIDSLIASNKAWIIFKEDRAPIALIPRTSKIINSDSEEGTYEYNVKFTINPQHEFENNTF